jgi:uncharacterized protein (TIGR03435 family)
MSAWIYTAGWVLVHFVWQGALIAVAAAVLLRLCRQTPSLRYVIACGAMGVMLLAVVATAAVVKPSAMNEPAPRTSTRTLVERRTEVLLPIHVSQNPGGAQVSSAKRVEAALPWIVSLWLFGVGVLLIRAGAGWWKVRCLHQRALTSMRSTWQAAGDRISVKLGLARLVRIVEMPQVDVPLVIGCLRPIVVLPIAAMSQLTTAQVEAIIAHELAHVRRHDYLVNLMQTLAETLLFYHPGVWWLSARIRDEREHCCDAAAVAVCGDPVGYAAALAELETYRSGELSLAAAATGGSLLSRVRRILSIEISEDSRTSSWTVGLFVAATVGGVAVNLLAQTPEPRPTFEVASVRANTSGSNQETLRMQSGGRFVAVNMPLIALIRNAYRLQDSQLVGGPDWIETTRYDITAKAEGDLAAPSPLGPPNTGMLMLQSLLEERFKLRVHREPREVPIYTLVRARPDGRLGNGLTVSTADCEALAAARGSGGPPPDVPKPGERPRCGARVGFGELTAGGQPLLALVSLLSATVGRSVVDRTGLTGRYDITLRWTPDTLPRPAPGTPPNQPIRMNGVEIDPNGPSIFTALQEQLGLKLDPTRGPVDVLVIDRVEPPSPD